MNSLQESAPLLNRRQAFSRAGVNLLGLTLADWMLIHHGQFDPVSLRAAAAEADAKTDDGLAPLNRFPRMVQEYFVQRVRLATNVGIRNRAAVKTREDAEEYVKSVQEKIRRCFGPEPERTPLNPRVTGKIERDAYTIEKVIFESRPGFLVTANLYLPVGKKLPAPGVIGTCGHSDNGKAAEAYQCFAQGLARMGYVCLIYDPIGQGERLQYVDDEWRPRRGTGTREHLHAGNQQYLVGDFFGMWRAWDGIRALDYLLTRKEVDPKHLGVTGNSGGGTMTTWLCGVEQRWTMAAPACFVTSFLRNMENELPADTEQCPPKVLALGLDHSDFLAAMAPKPVTILAQEKDYFDARGVEEAHQRLVRLYEHFGKADNAGLTLSGNYHGYSQENREAMYRWFNRATGISDAETEPEITVEKDEDLWCTPHGQVAELGSRTVFSFTSEKAARLAKERGEPRGAELRRRVAGTLRLRRRGSVPEYRILRTIGGRQYPLPNFVTYAVDTEPWIQALVYMLTEDKHYSRLPRDRKRALLYVSHLSSDEELRNEPLVRELIESEPDAAYFTCDVRGIGESLPNTCGQNTYTSAYGCDYFYSAHAIMLDDPYVGQKTFDVLRVIDWLVGNGYTQIHLAAKGWGALPATFAGLFSGNVEQVTLKNALTSYSDVAETEDYNWPLSTLLPDALARFDLPDCYAELAQSKKLRQIEPWGAGGTTVAASGKRETSGG